MFDILASLYRSGTANKTYLDQAVKLKWITQEQEDEIINSNGNVGVFTPTA